MLTLLLLCCSDSGCLKEDCTTLIVQQFPETFWVGSLLKTKFMQLKNLDTIIYIAGLSLLVFVVHVQAIPTRKVYQLYGMPKSPGVSQKLAFTYPYIFLIHKSTCSL